MPGWLIPTLKWGGVLLAIVSAIALIYVQFIASPAPENGVESNETLVLLCWILLVIGVVSTLTAVVIELRQGPT